MKRFTLIVLLVGVALVVRPAEAAAQIDLSRAIGVLLGGETSSEQNPFERIAEAAPSARDVVRTWAYERLFFDYLGANNLATVALQQLDNTVQAALKREGIVAGAFTMTLKRNGTGFLMHEGYAVDGEYAYSEDNGRVTIATTIDGTRYECGGFLTMRGDNLVVMVDARDAFEVFLASSPQYRTDPTVVGIRDILQSFKGIFISIEYRKF